MELWTGSLKPYELCKEHTAKKYTAQVPKSWCKKQNMYKGTDRETEKPRKMEQCGNKKEKDAPK